MARKGFTLIELLIVIAIVLILVAIALPNFLEAQIRARVTRAKSEIRSLAIAMESYHIDWKFYPAYSFPNYTKRTRFTAGLTWLTSPIAYIKSLPEDPFPGTLDQEGVGIDLSGGPLSYVLDGYEHGAQELPQFSHPHDHFFGGNLVAWCIYSVGPDTPKPETKASDNDTPLLNDGGATPISSYSPTNGTKSQGDILRYGGDSRWMGVAAPNIVARRRDFPSLPKPGQVVDGERYTSRFPPHLQN